MTGLTPGSMMKERFTVWLETPAADPVMVTLYVPGANVPVLLNVTVVVFPGLNGLLPKDTDVPAGLPVADNVMGELNPPCETEVKVVLAFCVPQAILVAATLLKENPLAKAPVMAKFALDISK